MKFVGPGTGKGTPTVVHITKLLLLKKSSCRWAKEVSNVHREQNQGLQKLEKRREFSVPPKRQPHATTTVRCVCLDDYLSRINFYLNILCGYFHKEAVFGEKVTEVKQKAERPAETRQSHGK